VRIREGERIMASVPTEKWGVDGEKISTTLADVKLKIAEHLINLTDFYRSDEVYSIMAETKVGAIRRSALVEKLKVVFSAS
jgi:hypothetical protein